MNVVFTLLVLLSVVTAAWKGSPPHPGTIAGVEVQVELEATSVVKVGSVARIEAGDVEFPGVVTALKGTHATLTTLATDGPGVVRFD